MYTQVFIQSFRKRQQIAVCQEPAPKIVIYFHKPTRNDNLKIEIYVYFYCMYICTYIFYTQAQCILNFWNAKRRGIFQELTAFDWRKSNQMNCVNDWRSSNVCGLHTANRFTTTTTKSCSFAKQRHFSQRKAVSHRSCYIRDFHCNCNGTFRTAFAFRRSIHLSTVTQLCGVSELFPAVDTIYTCNHIHLFVECY